MISELPGPEDLVLRTDAQRMVERSFLKLEEMQRTLLVLRLEGYDLAEIESITGISREVLRARLHRARRSLARHLEELTGTSAAALLAGSQS